MSRRNILLFCLVSLLSVVLFGFDSYVMVTDGSGQMSNCPLLGAMAFCRMNYIEHIAGWQSMFMALFQKKPHIFFTLLQIAFLMALSLNPDDVFRKKISSAPSLPYRPIRMFFIPSTLQEAFSDGILQPKIYL